LGSRGQLSPSVLTVEAGGGPARRGRLVPRSTARAAVRWPHETEPLLASWLRRACGAVVVLRSEFVAAG
jgi:hypothetical protein